MTRKDRLNAAYRYLRSQDLANKQKDVAKKMGTTEPNVSSALRGVETVLTDSFLRRFNDAYDGLFSEKWLLTGEGDMLARGITQSVTDDNNTAIAGDGNQVNIETSRFLDELAAQRRITEKLLAQNGRLIALIEKGMPSQTYTGTPMPYPPIMASEDLASLDDSV